MELKIKLNTRSEAPPDKKTSKQSIKTAPLHKTHPSANPTVEIVPCSVQHGKTQTCNFCRQSKDSK